MAATLDADRGAKLAAEPRGDELRMTVGGRLATTTVGAVWQRGISAVRSARARTLVIDAREVSYCDTAGASLLVALDHEQRAAGGEARLESFPDEFLELLLTVRRVSPRTDEAAEPRPEHSFPREVGRITVEMVRDCVGVAGYVGWIFAAMQRVVRRPGLLRWGDMLNILQEAGVKALPVVALITFLLGLVLTYQSAGTFQRYGADVYLADMLAISLVRELAPLMTAIALAARSSSAFAAEIGTMRVNEEVDALRVMAFDPVVFLALPRVFAVLLATPILSLFAVYAGLVGGAVVWVYTLDLPLVAYRNRVIDAVGVSDLLGGMVKGVAFGILVAAIGCIRGMQTAGGALAVGRSTTRAVVTGIVMIAVTDAVFAVVYYQLGI